VSVIALPQPATAPRRAPRWLTVFARRKIAVAGAILMAGVVAIAILAPALSRSPTHMDVAARLSAPGAAYWFGTDDVGRDVFSRVMYGARLSVLVGVAVVVFSFAVGVVCGVVAGYYLGASDLTLIARHVLPNCLSPVIVQGSFVFAAAVLTEAALSFLGVGVPPYVPSWGNILADGRLYIQQAPWLVLFPGAAIMLTILGLNLFGDGVRDLLDPKIRGLHTERQRAA
jgi:ABC-type dipeptide/oligopeptide/nickel transport system permease subunit